MAGDRPSLSEEKNPSQLDRLNDTRELRLERQENARAFHPDDVYREITRSPLTASVETPREPGQPTMRLADIGPEHADYALMQQIREGVIKLDVKLGRHFDESSERLTASLLVLAKEHTLESVDNVLLSSAAGSNPEGKFVFVVQGDLANQTPPPAVMATDAAVRTPVEQSLRTLERISQEHDQAAIALQTNPQGYAGRDQAVPAIQRG